MFERFSDGARRAVVLAQEEARSLGHDGVDAEHILLGLLVEGEGIALRDPARVWRLGRPAPGDGPALVDRCRAPAHRFARLHAARKKALEQSMTEALRLRERLVDTGHLLLALVDDEQAPTLHLLSGVGVNPMRVRITLLRLKATGTVPRSFDPPVALSDRASADPADLLTTEDVEAVWREQPLHAERSIWDQEVAGVLYRHACVRPSVPSAWLAGVAADVERRELHPLRPPVRRSAGDPRRGHR